MEEFENLYNWIESWHQKDGYGGFLHHAIHGTVNWEHARLVPSYTYQPLINGFINLYKKKNDSIWLNKAERAADELINILDDVNQFKYSGFEFAPKSGSIVHTINPLFAFYELYRLTGNGKYIDISKKVIESIICIYWRGDHFSGPFNMTLMVSAAIAEYCSITHDWSLHSLYGKSTFDFIHNHQVGAEGGNASGLYYRNIDDHSIIFPWYNTVKADAMIRYGRATGEMKWVDEGISLLKLLKQLIVGMCMLPHSFQKNDSGKFECISTPMLIAPTAYLFTQLQKNGLLSDIEIENSVKRLLSFQNEIGYFTSNTGYDWRSCIGVTAWNCFVFEFLSLNYYINCNPKPIKECTVRNGEMVIYENELILDIWYKDEKIACINKKTGEIRKGNLPSGDFYISPSDINKGLHLTKMWKQQNRTVSYIDELGCGVWLENNDGTLNAWSPYYKTALKQKKYTAGKHKYDKYAFILYHTLKPLLYNKNIVSFITKYI